MKQELKEGIENDMILGSVFADNVKQARYNKSAEKVLDELGIETI